MRVVRRVARAAETGRVGGRTEGREEEGREEAEGRKEAEIKSERFHAAEYFCRPLSRPRKEMSK